MTTGGRPEEIVLADLHEAKESLLNSEQGKSFHAHQLWVAMVIDLARELAEVRGVQYGDIEEIRDLFD